MGQPLRTCIVGVSIVVAACGSERETSEVDTPSWTFVEVWRKDGAADPDVPLTRITALAVRENGELLLTDVALKAALHLNADGSLRQTIGRAGDGPGEFSSPQGVGLIGDSIWVGDPFAGRIEVFGVRGEPLRTINATLEGADASDYALVPRRILSDGSLLMTPPGVSASRLLRGESTEQRIVAMATDGANVRELTTIPTHARDFVQFERGMGPNPIQTSPIYAASPKGEWLAVVTRDFPESANSSTYSVTVLDVWGDTAWSVTQPYEPVPVAPDYYDAWMESRSPGSTTTEDPGVANLLAAAKRATSLPDFHAPATEVVMGTDGSVWVARELVVGEPTRWDVFSARAELLAQATGPPGFRLLHASVDALWGQMIDELDTPSLVRLQRATAGSG